MSANAALEAAILETLQKTDNNKAKAARILKIDRTVLYEKMKRLGIPLQ